MMQTITLRQLNRATLGRQGLLTPLPAMPVARLVERVGALVITRNADVLPTFLVDGFVAGTWLPRTATNGPHAELRPFGRLSRANRQALEAEAERLLPTLNPGAFSRYPGTD
jgi:hypothetical protein